MELALFASKDSWTSDIALLTLHFPREIPIVVEDELLDGYQVLFFLVP